MLLSYGGWQFWCPVVALSAVYLANIRNPKLTNGKKRMVVTFMVLSILGLVFVAQYGIRHGWHSVILRWW